MIGKGLWKRTHKLSQTGSELDAIIEKADSLPEVSAADAGKALVVGEDGKITTGEAGGGTGEWVPDFSLTINNSGIVETPAEIQALMGANFELGKKVALMQNGQIAKKTVILTAAYSGTSMTSITLIEDLIHAPDYYWQLIPSDGVSINTVDCQLINASNKTPITPRYFTRTTSGTTAGKYNTPVLYSIDKQG